MPDCQPREGARAAISASVGDVLLELERPLDVTFVAGDEVFGVHVWGGGVGGPVAEFTMVELLGGTGEGVVVGAEPGLEPPASMAFPSAVNVVDAMGHPFPGPSKFCSVTAAALRRASCDAVLLSVGNVTLTEGFVVTNPAATFWFKDCFQLMRLA